MGFSRREQLEWVAISFSRGSSQTQGLNPDLLHCRQILYHLNHQGSPLMYTEVAIFFVCCRPGLVFCSWRDPCVIWQGGPVTTRQLASLQFAEMESSHRVHVPFLLSPPVDEKQVTVVLTLKGRGHSRAGFTDFGCVHHGESPGSPVLLSRTCFQVVTSHLRFAEPSPRPTP